MKAAFVEASVFVLRILKEAPLVEVFKFRVVRVILIDLCFAFHELPSHLLRRLVLDAVLKLLISLFDPLSPLPFQVIHWP